MVHNNDDEDKKNDNDSDSSTNVNTVSILKLLAISTYKMYEKKTGIVQGKHTKIIYVSTYKCQKIRNKEY